MEDVLNSVNGVENQDAGQGSAVGSQENNQNTNLDAGQESVNNPGAAKPEGQSKEENSAYAAARREAEKKLKDVEEKAKKDREIAKNYGKDYDVFSAEDIKEKYNMSLDQFETALLQQEYKRQGIDPGLLNKAIENHPAVKKAIERDTIDQEERRQKAIQEDLSRLHTEFPDTATVKTEEDLYALPEWKDMLPLVQRGYDLSDAYYKVNKAKILQQTAKGAEQRAAANMHDAVRRGGVVNGDGGGSEVDTTGIDLRMANAFGNDPREIAKYVKANKK